ncbi:MAG: hypothetical protein QMC36_06785 [Patescibacteria group bacterium]
MLAIHKHANPGAHPVHNALGHIGSFACVVFLLFGDKLVGCKQADIVTAIVMGLNALNYVLWLRSSGSTSPLIPAIFWGLLGIVMIAAGHPGCVP